MHTAVMLADNNTPAITIKQPLSKATFEYSLRHRQYRVLYNIGWCDIIQFLKGIFWKCYTGKRNLTA